MENACQQKVNKAGTFNAKFRKYQRKNSQSTIKKGKRKDIQVRKRYPGGPKQLLKARKQN